MQVVTSFRALNNLGNEQSGFVRLALARERDHYEFVISDYHSAQCVLARMTTANFSEAVRRGDASVERLLGIKQLIGGAQVDSFIGGPQVRRCDVEMRGNELWLVPESQNSPGVLLFFHWEGLATDRREMTAGAGAKVLAHFEDKASTRHWSAILMRPGSSVKISTFRMIPKEGRKILFLKTAVTNELTLIGEHWLTLSAEGHLLTL
jgi:heme-degrading monooxygenase HmoA